MLFQYGSKNTFDVNMSNGTSDITPNSKSVIRYFFLLLVLKNPSTIKNTKIGNAILPRIEKRLDKCNKNPSHLEKGLSTHCLHDLSAWI